MTIEGYSYEGWPIHPDYQPVPLQRSPRMLALPKIRLRDRIKTAAMKVFRR